MMSGFTEREELMTAEQLLVADIPNKSTELVRGRLIVREPPGTYHGLVQSRLNFLVAAFVHERKLGAVFGQDTGFRIASDPDTVLAPDLAFVRHERLSLIAPRGYAALAPDFIVEILSPDDRPGEVLGKIGQWLNAGVALAWVIDPARRVGQVYRADGSAAAVPADGKLDGEDVLPGFTLTLSELFE